MKKNINIVLIKILRTITLFVLFYITAWIILEMFNQEPLSTLLINLKIYNFYYIFINAFSPTILYLIIGISFLVIPYLIIVIYLGIVFLIKYIKRKRNIIKTIILFAGLIVTLLVAIRAFPMTSRYIIKVNSKVENISNSAVKEYIKENIKGNPYITYIEINRGFPDDYNVRIHYNFLKTQNAFLSDSDSTFVENNAINVTNISVLITIIALIMNIVLYIYFGRYITLEYKYLSDNIELNIDKEYSIKKSVKVTLTIIILIIIVIGFSIARYRIKLSKYNQSTNTIIENGNNDTYYTTIPNEECISWTFDNNVGIKICNRGSWSGKDIITFEKTLDGGITYKTQNPDGFDVHYDWEAIFINENVGFINDYGIPGNGDNYGLYVTKDSGKTLKKSNIIHPDNIEEKNLLVEGVPYYDNGILKLKVYTINHSKTPEKTYYDFYSQDEGENWRIVE